MKNSFYFVSISSKNITRCWGFFNSLKKAEKALEIDFIWHDNPKNTYAIIELYESGDINPHPLEEFWYIKENQKIIKIEKPDIFSNIINWGIG